MDGVSDNDNFTNALNICGLIDAIPNGKEFGFSCCNINYMMNGLNDLLVLNVDVSY